MSPNKRTQQAISEAEADHRQGPAKRPVSSAKKTLAELKREVARLVIDTTTKVTGKVLTQTDQKRINEEAVRAVGA